MLFRSRLPVHVSGARPGHLVGGLHDAGRCQSAAAVKRMVAYCGKEVVDLQRLTMGTLILDEKLKRGEWRRLTKEELEELLASIA